MLCSFCKSDKIEFLTPCGHQVHAFCLIRADNVCRSCSRNIKIFDLFWDIFRYSGMNPSEEYYKEISGCSNWIKGLAIWLIDNDREGWIFQKIQYRSKRFHGILEKSSFEKFILEESLLKGKLIFSLSCKNIKIDKKVIDTAWERDHLEILAKAYDLDLLSCEGNNLNRDPLMVAANNGDFNLLNRMINAKVNLNRQRKDINAAKLAFLSRSFRSIEDQFRFLDLLIDNEADLIYASEILLQIALDCKNTDLMGYLLQKGAIPKSTMMTSAIKSKSLEMVKLFHKAGINFNNCYIYQVNSIYFACVHESVDIAKYIIESKVDWEKDYSGFLSDVIQNNHSAIVELFLSYGILPSYDNLVEACIVGNFEMVKLLVDHGVDPRKSETECCDLLRLFNFEAFLHDGDKLTEIIDFFLKLGADIESFKEEKEKEHVVYKLCKNDKNLPVIEKLIEFGANIHFKSEQFNMTSFLNSCHSGSSNCVRLLLRNGANVNSLDEAGANCYLNAVMSGNLETLKITLSFSDKNFVDKCGKSALYYICKLKSKEETLKIFEFLTEEGVNMNILDKNGLHPILCPRILDNINPLLLEKYFESEENRNFRIGFDLEAALKINGDYRFVEMVSKSKENALKKMKLQE